MTIDPDQLKSDISQVLKAGEDLYSHLDSLLAEVFGTLHHGCSGCYSALRTWQKLMHEIVHRHQTRRSALMAEEELNGGDKPEQKATG